MFISKSAAETIAAGEKAARKIQPRDVVALAGDLGAGKTQFVKGIARGLNCSAAVTSPTFTLVHEYGGGRLPLFHFDFFRLDHLGALRGIGFDEYLFSDGVSVIEWADKLREAIPPRALWVKFEIGPANERRIDLSAFE